MAAKKNSSDNVSGFSARLMIGKGANPIPGTLGQQSLKKLHGMGKIVQRESVQQMTKICHTHSNLDSSLPPSKTSNYRDNWKSVQDCYASLMVANPRHFEFAVANLCSLFEAHGRELDIYVKSDVDKIFRTLRLLVLDVRKRLTARMRLLKIIEFRARGWKVENNKGNIRETSETIKTQSTQLQRFNQPIKYSREFLLKCWDSPLCRVMPAALQHTILHSDIYFLIRIPTFEDPSFLLKHNTSPLDIKSTVRDPHTDQSYKKHNSSWFGTMHSET
jgi:hypothetical protein